jgi:hypothetical protein
VEVAGGGEEEWRGEERREVGRREGKRERKLMTVMTVEREEM